MTPFVNDRPDFVFLAVRHTIACLFPDVDPEAIFSPGGRRGDMEPARIRQFAMYLMSVRLGVSQFQTGRHFSRDRSTVTHSVQIMEALAGRESTAALLDTAEKQCRALLALFAQVEAETQFGARRYG